VRLCQAMAQPALARDPRYATNTQRTLHRAALDDQVAGWCRSLPLAALAARLEQHEVPFSKVYDIDDLLADPHFCARGSFIELDDPELGPLPAPAVVPRFGGRPGAVPAVGPATGEHNRAVFGELGLDADDIRALQRRGVI
jgi:crotonobetainyl-CoA:carnitine CoA-transferase CaiB-like acyl-CoA transferase